MMGATVFLKRARRASQDNRSNERSRKTTTRHRFKNSGTNLNDEAKRVTSTEAGLAEREG